MKNNIILTVCVAVAMTFSLPSQAQRLIPKQRGIEVVGSVPLIKGEKLFTGIIRKTKCSEKIKRSALLRKTKCTLLGFPPPRKKCLKNLLF